MADFASLSRAQKAAAILVAMGKSSAGRLLKFFKQEELKALMEAARTLKSIPQAELERIVSEFENEFAEGAGLLDSGDTMNSIFSETLSPEEIDAIMEGTKIDLQVDAAEEEPIWPQLEALPGERLGQLLENEHPQVIAMILSKLTQGAAAGCIPHLPKTVRGETVKRMIALGDVPDKAQSIVQQRLRARLEDKTGQKDLSAGQARVASILNELDKTVLDELMEDVEAAGAPDLETLRSKLFSFDDVVHLSQKSRVALLDSLPADLVTLALRGSAPDMVEAVLSAVGARSRRMIEAELKDESVMPPAEEVARARKRIAADAIRLSQSGAVELPNLSAAA